jgi:hypothetical protein
MSDFKRTLLKNEVLPPEPLEVNKSGFRFCSSPKLVILKLSDTSETFGGLLKHRWLDCPPLPPKLLTQWVWAGPEVMHF